MGVSATAQVVNLTPRRPSQQLQLFVKSLNILTRRPSGDYRAFVILTGLQGENYYTTQKEIAACQQRSHAQARRLLGGFGGRLWRRK